MATDFETALAKATARPNPTIPAVVLSAIDRSGKEIYSKVSGHMGLAEDAPPITADATFWMASCTKLPTSIAALQCVERGLVGLDDPVEKWLPELKDAHIASLAAATPASAADGGIGAADAALAPGPSLQFTSAKNKVTLRHLLTHTSGLAYEWMNPTLMAWRAGEGKADPASLAGTVTKLYDTPLVFEPGKGWAYGPGVDWAGVLVERLVGGDGATLGSYLEKEIFGRLGEGVGKSTTFRLGSEAARGARVKERLLPNVHRGEDGTLVERSYGFSEEVREDSGGAGWYSCVADYMAILGDLLADEPKLLGRENVEAWLYRGHVGNKEAVDQLLKARTGMTVKGGDEAQEPPMNYSLGGLIWVTDQGILPKGSLAWGGLPNLKWFANREKGLAAMYASQVTPPADPQSQELTGEFFKEVWRIYGNSNSNGSK